jgi:hypothetical protein
MWIGVAWLALGPVTLLGLAALVASDKRDQNDTPTRPGAGPNGVEEQLTP